MVLPLLGACSGIFIYFAYNQVVFGIPVPVSGFIKSNVFSVIRWEAEGDFDIVRNLHGTWQVWQMHEGLLLALEITVYFLLVLLIWWFSDRSWEQRNWWFLVFIAAAFNLAMGHMAKFAHSAIYMHPHELQHARWSYVPAYLMMALILPLRCFVAIHFIHWFFERKWKRTVGISQYLHFSAGCVIFLLVVTDLSHPFRKIDETESRPLDSPTIAYTGTLIMNRLLPNDSVIGVTDAGVIGYFSRFPVVNLDGLANSYTYADLLKSTIELDLSLEFNHQPDLDDVFRPNKEEIVRRYGITHIVYNSVFLPGETIERPFSDRFLYSTDNLEPSRPGSAPFKLWQIKPSETVDQRERFWKIMASHFYYKSDEIGIVIDGRLAQIFIKDCKSEKLQNRKIEFFWISEDNKKPNVTSYVWKNPKSNALGFCIAIFKLPRPGNEIEAISSSTDTTQLLEVSNPPPSPVTL